MTIYICLGYSKNLQPTLKTKKNLKICSDKKELDRKNKTKPIYLQTKREQTLNDIYLLKTIWSWKNDKFSKQKRGRTPSPPPWSRHCGLFILIHYPLCVLFLLRFKIYMYLNKQWRKKTSWRNLNFPRIYNPVKSIHSSVYVVNINIFIIKSDLRYVRFHWIHKYLLFIVRITLFLLNFHVILTNLKH